MKLTKQDIVLIIITLLICFNSLIISSEIVSLNLLYFLATTINIFSIGYVCSLKNLLTFVINDGKIILDGIVVNDT